MTFPVLHSARGYCFFFDFDGTLTEIAQTPAAVRVEDRARNALELISNAASGAAAIITGREIEAVDAYLAPLRLPVAGVHGFERRRADGNKVSVSADEAAAQAYELAFAAFAESNGGVLLERKRGALALHYRLRPDLEAACLALAETVASQVSEVVLTRGKMVIEARFHRATKGTAISDFLEEPPFRGRVPLFAGDDVTDEDAFETVNALGGLSIKVGPGDTKAQWRAHTVAEFLDWLCSTAQELRRN